MSSALATDYVTESNLTGFQLPKGALELTDDDFPDEMVSLLEDVAQGMNGKCQYHELLVWDGGNVDSLAEALVARIPSTFTFKELEAGAIDKNSNYEEFSLTSSKVWYAAVWMDSPENVLLGWCSVVKK
ncbi:hypothetical protein [Deinococcus irradiatisoli]|nr:hypothetical protein [Deinococcus irradiatisoli]